MFTPSTSVTSMMDRIGDKGIGVGVGDLDLDRPRPGLLEIERAIGRELVALDGEATIAVVDELVGEAGSFVVVVDSVPTTKFRALFSTTVLFDKLMAVGGRPTSASTLSVNAADGPLVFPATSITLALKLYASSDKFRQRDAHIVVVEVVGRDQRGDQSVRPVEDLHAVAGHGVGAGQSDAQHRPAVVRCRAAWQIAGIGPDIVLGEEDRRRVRV